MVEERQADADLVELPAPSVGERGLLSFEFGPGDHLADATPLLLTPSVSDSA
jgi:hypothetical protein